jgi:hypothetical protein
MGAAGLLVQSWIVALFLLSEAAAAVQLSSAAGPLSLAATAAPTLAQAPQTAACLDNAGSPVEWWLQYKTPGICDTGSTGSAAGSSGGDSNSWTRGNVTLYLDSNTLAACAGGDCWQLASLDRWVILCPLRSISDA